MNPNLYADEAVRIAERAVALANQLRDAGVAAGANIEPVATLPTAPRGRMSQARGSAPSAAASCRNAP